MFLDAVTRSPRETKTLANTFAREVLKQFPRKRRALVFGLTGPLGSGKTTFLQGFAKGAGITARPKSPTFLLMRPYPLPRRDGIFWHIDCYRIRKGRDLLRLGIRDILRDPKNIVVIEWAEKIERLLPTKTVRLRFALGPLAGWRRIIIERR